MKKSLGFPARVGHRSAVNGCHTFNHDDADEDCDAEDDDHDPRHRFNSSTRI